MPTDKKHDKHRPFRLTRHFAMAGLASIVAATLILGQLYQHFAREHLIRNEERHNAELTAYIAGIVWPRFGAYLASLDGADGEDIRSGGHNRELHALVLEQIRRSRVLKIKIFNTAGLTLYSTDQSQIGVSKVGYPGFEAARRGRVISQLSFRDRFYAHAEEAELLERNLLSSYVPVRGSGGQVQAVIELYSDVTPLLEEIDTSHTQLVLTTITVMMLLYSVLYLIIKRADRLIRAQSDVQREHEQRIAHQANHDALTGLPNRRHFRDLLRTAMQRAEKAHHLIAVLFIDLDRFKPINDSLGHLAGDELLESLARRLTDSLRDTDIVSRVGGDEFTIILDHLDNVQHVERAAQRILNIIAEPFYLADKELSIGASIGIAIYPFDDQDIDELIKHADTAMYHAKESGRNCFRFFSQDMNAQAIYHMELERDLRNALRNGELEVYYQPRYDLGGNRVSGVEALARWHHPERGMVPPAEFIPVAEDAGLIGGIGHWVLKTACDEIATLNRARRSPLKLSVNVSARQFENPGFTEEVANVLRLTGLPAGQLELELTESMLMRSCEECDGLIEKLKALGIKLSLDDFGTGYSSLSYLKRLPLDILKIDRSFISDVATNSRDAALVFSIAGLANQLDMTVVAEGIETEEQLAFVRRCQCQEAQGYLISHPLPLPQLQDFLAAPKGRLRENA